MLTGSCLCGAIRYQVDHIQPKMGHCHCSMCRKFSGAAFSTFGEAHAEHFRWTAGEQSLQRYQADNGSVRQFCKHCGSSMTFAPASGGEGLVEFTLGTLDSAISLKPDANIYVAFKADWFEIDESLPCFDEGRS